MARIALRQLLDHAAEHDYGVPAFNTPRKYAAISVATCVTSL
jgi:fructose/tagatose bisphosphate aldolase